MLQTVKEMKLDLENKEDVENLKDRKVSEAISIQI